MSTTGPPDAASKFRAAAFATAASDFGADLPVGTTVVAASSRAGSTNAVAYPMGDRTIVWCAPELAPRIALLNRPDPLTADEFLAAAVDLGGSPSGTGRGRVLCTEPNVITHEGYDLFELDIENDADLQLLAAFVETCPDDELDEAELEMEDLDSAILVLRAPDGSIASYASARDWWMDADFDDIAVITHPDHRGKRLGAAVVAEFARRRIAAGRLMFYNCDVENLGSNRVAETAGFELVVTVAAASFA